MSGYQTKLPYVNFLQEVRKLKLYWKYTGEFKEFF